MHSFNGKQTMMKYQSAVEQCFSTAVCVLSRLLCFIDLFFKCVLLRGLSFFHHIVCFHIGVKI
jgi:hypothetical protein